MRYRVQAFHGTEAVCEGESEIRRTGESCGHSREQSCRYGERFVQRFTCNLQSDLGDVPAGSGTQRGYDWEHYSYDTRRHADERCAVPSVAISYDPLCKG